jgi:hypothetical protein
VALLAARRRVLEEVAVARIRVWLEAVGALVALFLATLTLVVPDWLEEVSGVDPDAHSGAVEWLIALAFAAVAAVLAVLARREWRVARIRRPAR